MARRRIPQVLLLIETSRAYGRGLVDGIAHYAERNGPWAISFEERGLADPLPRWLKQWRGDGIISRTVHTANVSKLRALGRPYVELFSYNLPTVPRVRPDEEAIAALAAEHFLERGIRDFAFFCTETAHWATARRQAFEQVLARKGHFCRDFDPKSLRNGDAKRAGSVDDRGIARWIRELPKPCGVLCGADLFAVRLLKACHSSGVSVPDQVAILGVDDDPVFCRTCLPRLSSIDLGSEQIGYRAAALLDQIMTGHSTRDLSVAVAPSRVVTRSSTDTLAVEDEDVAEAIRLIRRHACKRLKVTEVAATVGLSRRTLEQRFQQALQRSPRDEILHVRMETARTLLCTGNLAIGTVAKMSGFSSPKYFSRAFRKHTGVSPQAYRSQRRLPVDRRK